MIDVQVPVPAAGQAEVPTVHEVIFLGKKQAADDALRVFVEQTWPVPEPGTPFVPGVHVDAVCLYLWAMIRNCGRSVAEGWESAKLGWRTLFRLRRDYE